MSKLVTIFVFMFMLTQIAVFSQEQTQPIIVVKQIDSMGNIQFVTQKGQPVYIMQQAAQPIQQGNYHYTQTNTSQTVSNGLTSLTNGVSQASSLINSLLYLKTAIQSY